MDQAARTTSRADVTHRHVAEQQFHSIASHPERLRQVRPRFLALAQELAQPRSERRSCAVRHCEGRSRASGWSNNSGGPKNHLHQFALLGFPDSKAAATTRAFQPAWPALHPGTPRRASHARQAAAPHGFSGLQDVAVGVHVGDPYLQLARDRQQQCPRAQAGVGYIGGAVARLRAARYGGKPASELRASAGWPAAWARKRRHSSVLPVPTSPVILMKPSPRSTASTSVSSASRWAADEKCERDIRCQREGRGVQSEMGQGTWVRVHRREASAQRPAAAARPRAVHRAGPAKCTTVA